MAAAVGRADRGGAARPGRLTARRAAGAAARQADRGGARRPEHVGAGGRFARVDLGPGMGGGDRHGRHGGRSGRSGGPGLSGSADRGGHPRWGTQTPAGAAVPRPFRSRRCGAGARGRVARLPRRSRHQSAGAGSRRGGDRRADRSHAVAARRPGGGLRAGAAAAATCAAHDRCPRRRTSSRSHRSDRSGAHPGHRSRGRPGGVLELVLQVDRWPGPRSGGGRSGGRLRHVHQGWPGRGPGGTHRRAAVGLGGERLAGGPGLGEPAAGADDGLRHGHLQRVAAPRVAG